MTRDDIIRMAREAGISDTYFDFQMVSPEDLERFAALVTTVEREACAKVCEEIEDEYCERESLRYAELKTDAQTGASDCAHRIHARGDA